MTRDWGGATGSSTAFCVHAECATLCRVATITFVGLIQNARSFSPLGNERCDGLRNTLKTSALTRVARIREGGIIFEWRTVYTGTTIARDRPAAMRRTSGEIVGETTFGKPQKRVVCPRGGRRRRIGNGNAVVAGYARLIKRESDCEWNSGERATEWGGRWGKSLYRDTVVGQCVAIRELRF